MILAEQVGKTRIYQNFSKHVNRSEAWLVRLVTIITLGSGLLNLFSVMDDPLIPLRREILREFFPMEFMQLARSMTMLIGLALIISSINIYKRKRRAFQAVAALAVFSVLFHLTKGLDYEEAICSLALLAVMVPARKFFTVKSEPPDIQSALTKLSVAAGVAVLYGVAGFWLLDPKQFGINFHIGAAIHSALLYLTLQSDSHIIPATRYARWFLESLYLMSVTVLAYSGLALFRPVVYRFRIRPLEADRAREIVALYGKSAQDFFKLWGDKSYFFAARHDAFLAYGVAGSFAVVLGDPVGPEGEIEPLLREFTQMCRENDWGFGFYQVLPDCLPIYRRMGFRKLKIGDDAIVDLEGFSLEGRRMRQLRHEVRNLEKQGVRIREYEIPVPDEAIQEAKEVSDEWLEIAGRRERHFTLGYFDPEYIRSFPLVTAVGPDGKMLAFMNVIPTYFPGETTGDLIRRRALAPNGIMDYLLIQVFLRQKTLGFQRFNLGMAPMSGFQETEEASSEERAVHLFFQHLNFLFSYRGLRRYKAKFASSWEPRYAIYRSAMELPRLGVALTKLSEFKD